MHKLTALAVAVMLLAVAACATKPPPAQPWDNEGVRQRSGETGGKLEKEEKR